MDGSAKHLGGRACRTCGILHGKLCPAAGRQCHKCTRMNHFARMCRNSGGQKKQVNTVDDHHSDYDTMFIGAVNSADQDWVETVDFGNVKAVFKLDNVTYFQNQCMTKSQLCLCCHPQTRKLFEDLYKTSGEM